MEILPFYDEGNHLGLVFVLSSCEKNILHIKRTYIHGSSSDIKSSKERVVNDTPSCCIEGLCALLRTPLSFVYFTTADVMSHANRGFFSGCFQPLIRYLIQLLLLAAQQCK